MCLTWPSARHSAAVFPVSPISKVCWKRIVKPWPIQPNIWYSGLGFTPFELRAKRKLQNLSTKFGGLRSTFRSTFERLGRRASRLFSAPKWVSTLIFPSWVQRHRFGHVASTNRAFTVRCVNIKLYARFTRWHYPCAMALSPRINTQRTTIYTYIYICV